MQDFVDYIISAKKPVVSRLHPLLSYLLAFLMLCVHPGNLAWGQQEPEVSPHFRDFDLPEVADATSAKVTPEQERQLGEQWMRQFRGSTPILEDDIAQDYVESVIRRLAQSADLSDRRFHLLLVKNHSINAFAAPGNIIGVNVGLIEAASTEGEVASVLAHELAHLTQRHYARRINASQPLTGTLLLLAALAAALSGASEAAQAAIFATTAAQAQRQLANSREDEREADRAGLKILLESGYKGRSMADMFSLLGSIYRGQELPPQYLLTHPYSQDRSADAAALISEIPEDRGRSNSLGYQLLRIRLEALYSDGIAEHINAWQRELRNTKHSTRRQILAYGIALALSRQGKYDKALKLFANLKPDFEAEVFFIHALGEILLKKGDLGNAIRYLKSRLSFYPDNIPLNLLYANVLYEAGQLTEAAEYASKVRVTRPDLPSGWQMSARIHAGLGNSINYHRFEATWLDLVGRRQEAVRHMTEAMNLSVDDLQLYEALREQRNHLQDVRFSP